MRLVTQFACAVRFVITWLSSHRKLLRKSNTTPFEILCGLVGKAWQRSRKCCTRRFHNWVLGYWLSVWHSQRPSRRILTRIVLGCRVSMRSHAVRSMVALSALFEWKPTRKWWAGKSIAGSPELASITSRSLSIRLTEHCGLPCIVSSSRSSATSARPCTALG